MAASGRTCSGVSPSRSFRRGSAYPPARQPPDVPGGKAAHCHLVGPEAQLRGVGPHPGQSGRPLQELPGPEGGQHTVGQHKGLYPCGQKGQGHRLSLRRGNALVSPAGEDQHRPPRPVVGQQAGAAPAVYVQPRLRGAPAQRRMELIQRDPSAEHARHPFPIHFDPSIPAGFPFEKGKIKKSIDK